MYDLYEYISSKQIFISGLVNKMFYIDWKKLKKIVSNKSSIKE